MESVYAAWLRRAPWLCEDIQRERWGSQLGLCEFILALTVSTRQHNDLPPWRTGLGADHRLACTATQRATGTTQRQEQLPWRVIRACLG